MELSKDIAQLEERLEEEVLEAMDYLEISPYEKKTDGSNLPVNPVNRAHLWNAINPAECSDKYLILQFMAWNAGWALFCCFDKSLKNRR